MRIFKRKVKADPEAAKALYEARSVLRAVKARGAEVSEVAQGLRQLRIQNHFIEKLGTTIVGHGGGLT